MTQSPDAALGLLDLSAAVLSAGDPSDKVRAAGRAATQAATFDAPFRLQTPSSLADRPARPPRPDLVSPGLVPRRRLGSEKGRISLLHALAHIEFNAIDLAFDMAARFAGLVAEAGLDARAFALDWIGVGADEARHFSMLQGRLAELGAGYGDLPAHDGLWEAAAKTSDDVLARLAVAPLALEARGLDVTPGMIERLDAAGDRVSADLLRVILREEVGHVATGVRWFERLAAARGIDPQAAFRTLVAERLAGGLKAPFNHAARAHAGLVASYYS